VFVYASRAFGPHIGFLGGAAQLIEYVLAPPAIAFAIGAYLNQTFGLPINAVAFVAYVVFTLVNVAGMKLSVGFELLLTALAVIELCVFGAVTLPRFSWQQFSSDALPHGWAGAFAALPFAIWFYLAIEGVANVAEEAKDPQRVIPRGFLSAMATLMVLTAITLFGAVGTGGWHKVVYTNPLDPTAASDSPLPAAIAQIIAPDTPLFRVLAGVGLIGLLASFHGILIAASRAILELGRARYVPPIFGSVHPRTKTPVAALLVNMILGIAVLLTGKTADIILVSVFGALTLYILSSAAVIRLRWIAPELPRPYRTPLYPVTPVVALVLSVVCVVAMAWAYPKLALIYAAILFGSWLVFAIFVPAARREEFSSPSPSPSPAPVAALREKTP
jgi:ethanolamine permease